MSSTDQNNDDPAGDAVFMLGASTLLTTANLLIAMEIYSRLTPGGGVGQLLDGDTWPLTTGLVASVILTAALIGTPTARRFFGGKHDREH